MKMQEYTFETDLPALLAQPKEPFLAVAKYDPTGDEYYLKTVRTAD